MAGLNKVMLIGNLGKDPEVRRTESGIPVATFSIATSESYTDRNTNERKTITDWHNVVVWRGLAEVAEKWLKKGNQVYVEGKLKTRSYDDSNNVTRYVTEIVADNFVMLGGKNDSNGAPSAPQSTGAPTQAPDLNAGSADDDDLPF